MITFVRILTNNVMHPGARLHGSIKSPNPMDEEDHQLNPWKKELERLARCQQQKAGIAVPNPPEFPKASRPSKGTAEAGEKQGTLTDQKVWWGRSIDHRTYAPGEIPAINRVPPKTIHRWQQ